jgi:hypothetical protein
MLKQQETNIKVLIYSLGNLQNQINQISEGMTEIR